MTAGPVTPRTTEERTHFYCIGKERFRSIMSSKETGEEFLARFRGREVGEHGTSWQTAPSHRGALGDCTKPLLGESRRQQ